MTTMEETGGALIDGRELQAAAGSGVRTAKKALIQPPSRSSGTIGPVASYRNSDMETPRANGYIQHSSHAVGSQLHPQSHSVQQHQRGGSLDETRVVSQQTNGVGVRRNSPAISAPVHPSNGHPNHHSHPHHQQPPQQQQQQYHPNHLFAPSYSSSKRPGGHHHSSSTSSSGSLHYQQHPTNPHPPEVKFVNSTVENLEDQIRKEEAPKKKRTRTTPEQLRILQKAFIADPMPNSLTRVALAKKLGMNARAVQVWFQNRRAKAKLEAKRAECGGGTAGGGGMMSNGESEYDDDGLNDDDTNSVQSDGPPPPPRSFRATNQSLKATGLVGRMAFPADMEYLSPSYFGGEASHQPPPTLTRSQSLPFLGGGQMTLAYQSQQQQGQGAFGPFDDYDLPPNNPNLTDMLMLMETGGGGMAMSGGGDRELMQLSRSDSAPFIPYEFSAGSSAFNGGYNQMADYPAMLSRCQSMPTSYPEQDLDSVWPANVHFDHHPPQQLQEEYQNDDGSQDDLLTTTTTADMDAAMLHSQAPSSNHLRRSLSLPNVYQPELSGYIGLGDRYCNGAINVDPVDTIPELDELILVDPLDDPSRSRHSRSRSHSISHHPDYPANLNDYLTVPSHLDPDC